MALSANPTTPRKELGGRCYFDYTNGRFAWKEFLQASGSRLLEGWQLRYIYFIDSGMPETTDLAGNPVLQN